MRAEVGIAAVCSLLSAYVKTHSPGATGKTAEETYRNNRRFVCLRAQSSKSSHCRDLDVPTDIAKAGHYAGHYSQHHGATEYLPEPALMRSFLVSHFAITHNIFLR